MEYSMAPSKIILYLLQAGYNEDSGFLCRELPIWFGPSTHYTSAWTLWESYDAVSPSKPMYTSYGYVELATWGLTELAG